MTDADSNFAPLAEVRGKDGKSQALPVLLFYDGFEVKSREGYAQKAYYAARGAARSAYRMARGLQVYTGFYVAFRALVRSLRECGADVHINDFATARKNPRYPIGLAGYPSVLDHVDLANPIIFGPGDYGFPDDVARIPAKLDIRRFIQPSDWAASLYRDVCGDKMMVWPVGIDADAYPDLSRHPKDIDVLIYDKIRWNREQEVPRVLGTIKAHLESKGRSFEILRYGHHNYVEYSTCLRRARSLLFLCEHETQGLAYQEAMSANVPVIAWDEGLLVDPLQRKFAAPDLVVSSVPYFDERCGERFKMAEFAPVFDRFWSRLPLYNPRAYVLDSLGLRKSGQQYLDAYRELM
jgi:hypothetical protein